MPRDRLTLAAIWGSDKRAGSYLAADSSRFFEISRFSPDPSAKVGELPAALHEGFLALFCLHTPFRQSTPPHGANSHSGPDEPRSGKSRSKWREILRILDSRNSSQFRTRFPSSGLIGPTVGVGPMRGGTPYANKNHRHTVARTHKTLPTLTIPP